MERNKIILIVIPILFLGIFLVESTKTKEVNNDGMILSKSIVESSSVLYSSGNDNKEDNTKDKKEKNSTKKEKKTEKKKENKKSTDTNKTKSSMGIADVSEHIISASSSLNIVNDVVDTSVVEEAKEDSQVASVPDTGSNYSILSLIGIMITAIGICGLYGYEKLSKKI